MKGRRPDYKLKAYDKATDRGGDVGAAWINDDGSISITLNMGVVLAERDKLSLNLFKNEPYDPNKRYTRRPVPDEEGEGT